MKIGEDVLACLKRVADLLNTQLGGEHPGTHGSRRAEARRPRPGETSYLPLRLACDRSEAATDFAALELFGLLRIFEAMLASFLLVVILHHLPSAPSRHLPKHCWLNC